MDLRVSLDLSKLTGLTDRDVISDSLDVQSGKKRLVIE